MSAPPSPAKAAATYTASIRVAAVNATPAGIWRTTKIETPLAANRNAPVASANSSAAVSRSIRAARASSPSVTAAAAQTTR